MRIGGQDFRPGGGPYVVGVVNLSPESTNRDSIVADARGAVARARRLAAAGARIVDLGARSSHYAAADVSWRVERDRLLPAVYALKEEGFAVSVDTWDARVVRGAAAAGADLVNDSDGFQSRAMIAAVAESGLPVVIPFLNGANPRAARPVAGDPFAVMLPWFERALGRAEEAGVRDVILDPGLGYAQRGVTQDARDLLQRRVFAQLERVRALGHPVLAAVFRKPRRETSIELVRMMVAGGADFLRTHEPELVTEAISSRGPRERSRPRGARRREPSTP